MKKRIKKTNILLSVIPSVLQWQKVIANEYDFITSLKYRKWNNTLHLSEMVNLKK